MINLDNYRKDIELNLEQHTKGVFKLGYHLMPPVGWLNDPNGLCKFKDSFHFYYQYAPNNVNNGLKGWGYYQTKDFIHYIDHGMVLYPDHVLDKDGCYSGSAIVHDEKIHYFYTGNVKQPGDHDYIISGREHNTITFTSKDGKTFTDKKCIFKNSDYPSDLTCHVRDPKIEKIGDDFYMVLGARTKDDVGCVLLYKSKNLEEFEYVTRFTSDQDFGYMWECPDLIVLEGKKFLLSCPQGIETKGYLYENIYQNGYFELKDDFIEDSTVDTFVEMDLGFDIYASQTFLDDLNRRIYIGWMGLPDVDYTNPTVKDHWQHALTMPRELYLKNGIIHQKPLDEIKSLFTDCIDRLGILSSNCFNIRFEFNNFQEFELTLRTGTMLIFKDGLLTLQMDQYGFNRSSRHLEINEVSSVEIYSDTSSLEIFINDGFKVFTTRVYDFNTFIGIIAKDYNFKGNYISDIKVERG